MEMHNSCFTSNCNASVQNCNASLEFVMLHKFSVNQRGSAIHCEFKVPYARKFIPYRGTLRLHFKFFTHPVFNPSCTLLLVIISCSESLSVVDDLCVSVGVIIKV